MYEQVSSLIIYRSVCLYKSTTQPVFFSHFDADLWDGVYWGSDTKMILFDLIYEFQGDRTKKVGVIDTEFIIHKGIPTLGGSSKVLSLAWHTFSFI